eukprot:3239182-Rhodomonas_salina.5
MGSRDKEASEGRREGERREERRRKREKASKERGTEKRGEEEKKERKRKRKRKRKKAAHILVSGKDAEEGPVEAIPEAHGACRGARDPVSYTHLTLPTICSV